MSLSWAYGVPPEPDAAATLLLNALDLGYTHIDSAALYGFGANEALIGRVLKSRRNDFVLASKGGMSRNAQGQREIDGRPESIRRHCEESLTRLQTEVIDLYYLHRWDKRVPVEDSVGALSDLVGEGKVKTIGLSEVSAATIRKAHRVHPVTSVQSEYSLWTRNPEVAVLDTCRELGITFVAFSPLARGFLTGTLRDTSAMPAKTSGSACPGSRRITFHRICNCSTGWPHSPGSKAARWASWPWPGYWPRARTSSRSPGQRNSITWKKTPVPLASRCLRKCSIDWTLSSTRARCPVRGTHQRSRQRSILKN
jgi:aryl-alcohol dehydrogenase-like predicted oxidoreductase